MHKSARIIIQGTHKNKNSFSIFLPALDHLVIIFLCGFGAYLEERCRVGGFSSRWRWLNRFSACWLPVICPVKKGVSYFVYVCELGGQVRATCNTHLNCSPPQCPHGREYFETLDFETLKKYCVMASVVRNHCLNSEI
jgi:hypothetical protein